MSGTRLEKERERIQQSYEDGWCAAIDTVVKRLLCE
jgi:hypothetical protein